MHPDLLNNSLFLRYYQQWQENPASIVFASIAEFFLRYNMIDDARKVCEAGLVHHPQLISGRLVLAKILCAKGDWAGAEVTLGALLAEHPRHEAAAKIMRWIERFRQAPVPDDTVAVEVDAPTVWSDDDTTADIPLGWRTVTMAKIFAVQGHHDKARQIYESILHGDPGNEAARQGLVLLATSVGG